VTTLSANNNKRVVSGMRPTGRLHLGHYHGVLKNWVDMQRDYECYFFIADWHALTSNYANASEIPQHVEDLLVDWLAVGIDPGSATLFVQSMVPEHAELHLLLSMITPLSWLERVPTFKDQQAKMPDKDLSTYGFFGYPLLQSADILLYKAGNVPVGEDQVSHIELTREVARRFNHFYGREPNFAEKAEEAIKKMGKKYAKIYKQYRKAYQEKGDQTALETACAFLEERQNLSINDRNRLRGYLEGGGNIILPEPQPLLTKASKMPGLDGQKMSKSYGNTIALRDSLEDVEQKVRKMPTDPQRVRKTDAGDPEKCPVWQLHQVYSDDSTKQWVVEGCRSAGIGCLDCKRPIIDAIQAELKPMHARIEHYQKDKSQLRNILQEGSEVAREVAKETMEEVQEAMRFSYDSL